VRIVLLLALCAPLGADDTVPDPIQPVPVTPFLPDLEGPAKAKAGRIVQFRITGEVQNCAVEWAVPESFDPESYRVADDGLSITLAHDPGIYTLQVIVSCNGDILDGVQQPPRIHRLKKIFELTGPRPPPGPVDPPVDPLPPPDDPVKPKISGAYVVMISESDGRPAGSTQMMQRVLASLPAIEASGAIIDPDQKISGTSKLLMDEMGYRKVLQDGGVSLPAIIVIDPKATAGSKVLGKATLPATESDILSFIKKATGR
jgi:hypothetical protein